MGKSWRKIVYTYCDGLRFECIRIFANRTGFWREIFTKAMTMHFVFIGFGNKYRSHILNRLRYHAFEKEENRVQIINKPNRRRYEDKHFITKSCMSRWLIWIIKLYVYSLKRNIDYISDTYLTANHKRFQNCMCFSHASKI